MLCIIGEFIAACIASALGIPGIPGIAPCCAPWPGAIFPASDAQGFAAAAPHISAAGVMLQQYQQAQAQVLVRVRQVRVLAG